MRNPGRTAYLKLIDKNCNRVQLLVLVLCIHPRGRRGLAGGKGADEVARRGKLKLPPCGGPWRMRKWGPTRRVRGTNDAIFR
jgi:hypothetical protein